MILRVARAAAVAGGDHEVVRGEPQEDNIAERIPHGCIQVAQVAVLISLLLKAELQSWIAICKLLYHAIVIPTPSGRHAPAEIDTSGGSGNEPSTA